MNKNELRKIVKEKRNSLTEEYCLNSDKIIFEKLISFPEYANAKNIFIYVSKEKEVNTRNIIVNALNGQKNVYIPRCIDDETMEARRIKTFDDLKIGKFEILEPKEYCEVSKLKSYDLCIIPCLSCDKKGNRLGYGKGYFDRFLSNINCCKVVLCYNKLILDKIPNDELDIRVENVLTEVGLYGEK